MGLLLLQAQKAARISLYSQQDAAIPNFSQGETRPLSVSLITALSAAAGAQIYVTKDLTGWTFRAGLGNGFLPPAAGIFTLTFGANTTANLPYDADAEAIAAALNSLASITAAGGITVTLENGLFVITFGNTGAQSGISGTVNNLAPLCIMDFGRLLPGAANIQEVQTLRIAQNPGAYVDLTAASAPASASVTVNRAGGGGYNHKITVGFSCLIYGQDYQQPYAGKWTLIVGDVETALIDYSAGASDVQTAIEALSTVGAGNVQVSENADGSFLIAFQGALANTNMGTITADGSLLSVIPYLSGTLDLRTPGIDLLLGGQTETECFFEIEGTPPAGTVQKLFREQVTLQDSILDPSDQTPQPFDQYLTQTQGDARYRLAFVAAPLTMTSAGMPGQEAYGQSGGAWYRYLCVAPNVWQREELSDF